MNIDFLKVFVPCSEIYKSHIGLSNSSISKFSGDEYVQFCKNISEDEKLSVKSFSFDVGYQRDVKLNMIFDYDGKEYTTYRGLGKIIDIESNCGAYLYDGIGMLIYWIASLKTSNNIRRFLTLLFDKLENNLNKNILTFTGNFETRDDLLKYLLPNISESQYTIVETKFQNKNSRNKQVVGNINARASSVLPLLKEDKDI